MEARSRRPSRNWIWRLHILENQYYQNIVLMKSVVISYDVSLDPPFSYLMVMILVYIVKQILQLHLISKETALWNLTNICQLHHWSQQRFQCFWQPRDFLAIHVCEVTQRPIIESRATYTYICHISSYCQNIWFSCLGKSIMWIITIVVRYGNLMCLLNNKQQTKRKFSIVW